MRATLLRLRPGHGTFATRSLAAAALASALALTGCTIPAGSDSAAPATAEPAPLEVAESTPTARATPTPTAQHPPIGKTIYVDPGHGGPLGDAAYEQVPDGRGGYTQCQSEGAATLSGLQEHTFAWQTAQLLAADLKALGAVVITSREDDTGSGACVDQRAEAANRAGADAFVALHADAGPEFGYGFFINYATPTGDEADLEQSADLAVSIRDAMTAVELTPSTYAGEEGLSVRDDLAELNLSAGPAVLIQLANMGNGIEGALLGDPAVRRGYAKAVSTGLVDFLTAPSAPVR